MLEPIKRVLQVRSGEARLVLTLGVLLLVNALAQQVTEITAISNFVSAGGAAGMLIVWSVDGALVIGLTSAQALVVDRFSRFALVSALMLLLTLVFALLWLLFLLNVPPVVNYALLFLVSEQQWLIFPLVFWLLAGDIFNLAQSKRLFPLVAAFGFAGKLLGIGAALVAPRLFTRLGVAPESLLVVNVGIYLLAFAVMFVGLRGVQITTIGGQAETLQETLTEGWSFIKEVPSFRFITLSVIAVIVAETALEYHFLAVSDAVFQGNAARYQAFYSLYQLVRTVASLAILGLVANRVIGRIGLKNSFLVLPIGAIVGALLMLLNPASLTAALCGLLSQKLPQYTIDENARKSFQALAPERIRGRVSMFMDSYVYSAGTIAGSMLIGIIVFAGVRWGGTSSVYIYLGLGLTAGLLALGAILKMRAVYDVSLLNWRLQRRKRGRSVLDELTF